MSTEASLSRLPAQRDPSAARRPMRGFALPVVLLIGLGAHLAVAPVLEATQIEMRASAAQGLAVQSLADTERALQAARVRLESVLSFPTAGCTSGLCANLGAPTVDTYDWTHGMVHQGVPGISGSGWWIESMGYIAAGASAGDCSGTQGGCEYVRVLASAAPGGVRRSLEACYRIRRAPGLTPMVTRISWRETRLP